MTVSPPRAPRARRRRWLPVAVSAVIFFGSLEATLRWLPRLVTPRFGNYVYSRYGAFPGGIYFYDKATRVKFMRPGLDVVNYWNGYSWRHRTDARGFRNPPGIDSPTTLLLGDSLIYGHGVPERDTVAAVLRSDYGASVYNMARQGDCLFDEYVLLRLYWDELRAPRAILFVFLNDFSDVLSYRRPEEIVDPPELTRFDYAALRRRARDPRNQNRVPLRLELFRLDSVRLLYGLAKELGPLSLVPAAEAAGPTPPPYLAAILDDDPFRRVGRYYRLLLSDLAARAARRDASLEIVLLDPGTRWQSAARRAADRLDRFLRPLASELGLGYLTTRGEFDGCTACFLPHDGHLTAEGHRRLARFLVRRHAIDSPAAVEAPPDGSAPSGADGRPAVADRR